MNTLFFEETQRLMDGPFSMYLIIGLAVLTFVIFLKSQSAGLISLFLLVGGAWLVIFGHMAVTVDASQVHIKWYPFVDRSIPWTDIQDADVRMYDPGSFSGWGIKRVKGGTAYSIDGEKGLELTLTGGEKVLIGSQRPEELLEAVKKIRWTI